MDDREIRIGAPLAGELLVRRRKLCRDFHRPARAPEALGMAGLPTEGPWQICRFSLPSHVMIEVGVAPVGEGGFDAPADRKAYSVVVDFITPETETSHWYFWGMARRFAVDDPAVTDAIRQGQHTIFSEDLEMLERQQGNLLHYPEKRLLKLNIDAGGARSRLMIERAIAAERKGAELLAQDGVAG